MPHVVVVPYTHFCVQCMGLFARLNQLPVILMSPNLTVYTRYANLYIQLSGRFLSFAYSIIGIIFQKIREALQFVWSDVSNKQIFQGASLKIREDWHLCIHPYLHVCATWSTFSIASIHTVLHDQNLTLSLKLLLFFCIHEYNIHLKYWMRFHFLVSLLTCVIWSDDCYNESMTSFTSILLYTDDIQLESWILLEGLKGV